MWKVKCMCVSLILFKFFYDMFNVFLIVTFPFFFAFLKKNSHFLYSIPFFTLLHYRIKLTGVVCGDNRRATGWWCYTVFEGLYLSHTKLMLSKIIISMYLFWVPQGKYELKEKGLIKLVGVGKCLYINIVYIWCVSICMCVGV